MAFTNPYRQHHYLGEHVNTSGDAEVATWLSGVGWSASVGMMYYDSTNNAMRVYYSTGWANLDAGGTVPTLSAVLTSGNTASDDIDMDDTYKIINLASPTDPTDAATKGYVDSVAQGLDWQESVKGGADAEPSTPTTGDRWVVVAINDAGDDPITGVSTGDKEFTVAGDLSSLIVTDDVILVLGSTGNDRWYTVVSSNYSSGDDETTIEVAETIDDATVDGSILYTETGTWSQAGVFKIAEWDGAAWVSAPVDSDQDALSKWIGAAAYGENDQQLYVFNGTTGWIQFGATIQHNSLLGLQGGTTDEYYHMTLVESGHFSSTSNPHSVTLDQAYDAGKTISVDDGNLLMDVADGYDVEIDLQDNDTVGKGFVIDRSSDYFKVTVASASASLLAVSAAMYSWDVEVGYPPNGTLTPYYHIAVNGQGNEDADQYSASLVKTGVYAGTISHTMGTYTTPDVLAQVLSTTAATADLMAVVQIKAKNTDDDGYASVLIDAGKGTTDFGGTIYIGTSVNGQETNLLANIEIGTKVGPLETHQRFITIGKNAPDDEAGTVNVYNAHSHEMNAHETINITSGGQTSIDAGNTLDIDVTNNFDIQVVDGSFTVLVGGDYSMIFDIASCTSDGAYGFSIVGPTGYFYNFDKDTTNSAISVDGYVYENSIRARTKHELRTHSGTGYYGAQLLLEMETVGGEALLRSQDGDSGTSNVQANVWATQGGGYNAARLQAIDGGAGTGSATLLSVVQIEAANSHASAPGAVIFTDCQRGAGTYRGIFIGTGRGGTDGGWVTDIHIGNNKNNGDGDTDLYRSIYIGQTGDTNNGSRTVLSGFSITFQDNGLSSAIPFSSGTGLTGFTATSIVGALNELMSNKPRVFVQGSAPSSGMQSGDIWINNTSGYEQAYMYVVDGWDVI